MSVFTRLAVAGDQSQKMAETLGVDVQSILDPATPSGANAYRGVVLRCASCNEAARCARLLAENTHLDMPPDYCRNAGLLRALQRKKRVTDR